MGRLFWKFFIFIWLAQVIVIAAMSVSFWLRDQAHEKALRDAGVVFDEPRAEERFRGGKDHRPPWFEFAPPPPHEFRGERPPGPPGFEHDGPPDQRHAHRHRPLRFPLLAVAIALLASLVSAAGLAWYVAKPIRSLRSAFAGVASGNLSLRIRGSMGKRRDELADLGCDFDRMTEQLESVVNGQRRLLHDVSHELRSPMARLQAAIGLVRQHPDNADKVANYLQRIERETERMDNLVGELLTLSRLEAGVRSHFDQAVDMGELLHVIVEDAQFEAQSFPPAEQRQIVLQGETSALVQGNPELLHRAIENVVRNAIKHTPAGTEVVVALHETPSRQLSIQVMDHGNGVADGELESIFQPFFRSKEGNSPDGHGLGLAIARNVLTAHQGSITAQNRPEGGLCVHLLLPMMAGEFAE